MAHLIFPESSVSKQVRSIIAKKLDIDEARVVPGASLTGLGADSLDQVDIALVLESEFRIDIPDDLTSKVSTVSDAVVLVEKIIKEGGQKVK